ncbi:MAG: hypothetical protein BGO39_35180 [Chloroflexi bacterium 54-19]|nr:MAG: hypothetical protein BGO39_35180 [Chloroflexi bacterium 54-19]
MLVIFLAWQQPFTYTVNAGQGFNDSWELTKGWGDQERNDHFSYRWTIDAQAEVRLPDVGWPSQVRVLGLAPRPDNQPPTVTLDAGGESKTFQASPANSAVPPDEFGRLTFEVAGPRPAFSLDANTMTIGSDLYQPQGDPRQLGLVVSQVTVQTQPNRFGFVVPPLAPWLGWTLAASLVFLWLRRAGTFSIGIPFLAIKLRNLKGATLGGGIVLLVFVVTRLVFPQWLTVNGSGIAWGSALPLLAVVLLSRRPKALAWVLWILFGAGLLAVYYGVALAAFAATICVVTAMVFLALALRHKFSRHLENTGLAAALSLGATWGLLQGQLARSDDIPSYHLYWVNELDRMVQQGNFYPRFAPDFNWGQGGLVFNYYGPMTRYLVEILHLVGLTFSNAMMLHQVMAVLFGMVGTYFWCDELLKNRLAAVLGALAFCYFPYNIAGLFASGWVGNTWAAAFLPWIFLWLVRVVRRPDSRTAPVWLGLSVAGLPLNNNPQSAIFLPLGGIFFAGLLLIEWRKGNLRFWRTFFNVAIGAAITLGVSAFFILPGLLEVDKIGMNIAGPHAKFFANWPDDLALWRPIYPNMEDFEILGTLHFLLAALGGVVLWWRRPLLRGWVGLLGGLVAITFFLQWPASSFFWDTFSFFSMINFSSRLMAPAIVFAAPLVGGLVLGKTAEAVTPVSWLKTLTRSGWQLPGVALLTGLMVYASLYGLTYVYWPVKFDGFISQKALTEQVYRSDVTYLPKGLTDYSQIDGYFPPVFNDNRPANTGDLLSWDNTGPDSFELQATLSKPGQVTVPLLWFADNWWSVTDQTGRKYVTTDNPVGHRMIISLDAGQSTLQVKFVDPPLRTVSNIVSVLSWLAVLAWLVVPPLLRLRKKRPVEKPEELATAGLSLTQNR